MFEVGGQNRDFVARAVKGVSKKLPNRVGLA